MAHKKKENKSRKRKQPIPPVSRHKTKKEKLAEKLRKKDWCREI